MIATFPQPYSYNRKHGWENEQYTSIDQKSFLNNFFFLRTVAWNSEIDTNLYFCTHKDYRKKRKRETNCQTMALENYKTNSWQKLSTICKSSLEPFGCFQLALFNLVGAVIFSSFKSKVIVFKSYALLNFILTRLVYFLFRHQLVIFCSMHHLISNLQISSVSNLETSQYTGHFL